MINDPAPIAIGDIDLFDNQVPALFGGNYWVSVTHTLQQPGTGSDTTPTPINTNPLGAVQELVVTAPQFTLLPSEIVSQHPPVGSSGLFGQELPHVVFGEPALPWERAIAGPAGTSQPWLALLVLTDDELLGPVDATTRSTSIAIADFLSQDLGAFKATLTPEDDVDTTQSCNYIELSTATFQAVMPRIDELRFLAHCRQANVSDKAAQGLDPNGLFSTVVANRLPAQPVGNVPALRNIVHLVSVEGLEAVLTEAPDFQGHDSVVLLSLASWTFQCLPDNAADFRGLVDHLVAAETTTDGTVQPAALWLRLPAPSLPAATDAATGAEITARLANGFVPLAYHTRTGEDAFAWYRGPLAPVVPQPLATSGPFLSSDAAIAYQPAFGTFDLSLATAWQAGRAAALSDKAFGQALLDWRRRSHALTDGLLARLRSSAVPQAQIDALGTDTSVHDAFIGALDTDLLAAIGNTAHATALDASPPGTVATPAANPKAVVQAFLADASVQQSLQQLVSDDLVDIAQWLARLLLLYPLPFNLLVPDERLLEPETLRFFYLDGNWTEALLDGALSLGLDCSRQTFFQLITRGIVHDAALEAAKQLRASLTGAPPAPAQADQNLISGFLLRSALVSGWPTLAVRPYLADGTVLRVLRMDHLSSNVMLCLFWGVPDHVEISEPQEGFRFGTDDDGNLTLRNLVAPSGASSPPLGRQIGSPLAVFDTSGAQALGMRAAGSRVLNLDPSSPAGLVQTVQAAVASAAGAAPPAFGPAAFALQMVKAPEAIRFMSQATPPPESP